MAYFAELNAEGVCIAVSEQPRMPAGDRFVALDALDYSLLRKRRVGGEWLPAEPRPQPVPEVSMAQAVIALSRAGIAEADVAAAIDALPDGPSKTEARIWWARSSVMRRNHHAVAVLAPLLGLTEEQVDALFAAAAAVQA